MSFLRANWIITLWVVFVAIGVGIPPLVSDWGVTSFHVLCITLAVSFCLPVWPSSMTLPFAGASVSVAAAAFAWDVAYNPLESDELTELPLVVALCAVILRYAVTSRRRVRDFVRVTSHQLRTPLTIALGHAELMQRSLESGLAPSRGGSGEHIAVLKNDIRLVVEELKRLSAISNRLLRMDVEQGPVCDGDIDVERLVVGTIRRWQSTAVRCWTWSVSVHGTFPGDEEQMSMALDSLVENAVKATIEGDQIAITARPEGQDLIIAVSDSGCGIAEQGQKHVFDRSSRANGQQTSTGLGLSIVKAIVEHHGGSVQFESTPGQGTSVSMRIGGFWPVEPPPLSKPRPAQPDSVSRDTFTLLV